MTLEKFQAFIRDQDLFFKTKQGSLTEKEVLLVRMVKIGEEFGELCDEVLASLGAQRDDKLSKIENGNLEGEFADVLITLFLLAEKMEIDVFKALDAKTEKIINKHRKKYKALK